MPNLSAALEYAAWYTGIAFLKLPTTAHRREAKPAATYSASPQPPRPTSKNRHTVTPSTPPTP
jgi:hypothetical protein